VRRAFIAVFMMLCALVASIASPAYAKNPPKTSPPTTISSAALAHKTTQVLTPLVVFGAIAFGLSFLAEEVARSRKRSRRARQSRKRSVGSRGSRTKIQGRTNTRRSRRGQTSSQPTGPRPTAAAAPQPQAMPASEHLWGRQPGTSANDRIMELERQRNAWIAGRDGERTVGAELDLLPAGEWWVLHDVPRGTYGTNIDHLMVGVGGVFTINTKNVAGNVWVASRTLMVAGHRTNFLPVAASEARDTSMRLTRAVNREVQVHPVLVFVSAITVREHPSDVTVIHVAQLRAWLTSLPHILSPQDAYDIVLAADKPTTWS